MNRKAVGWWVIFGLLILFLLVRLTTGRMNGFWSVQGLGVWIAAFLTLCILSFLYQDNPFYKFAEHLFVGVSAAYWMVMGIWTTLVPNLIARLFPSSVKDILPEMANNPPQWRFLIPLVLGFLLLTRLLPKVGWLSRWALAFIIGTTAGLNFIRYLQSDFIVQVRSTLISLVSAGPQGISWGGTFSNVVLIGGVFCGLVYFFCSKEHKGAFGGASKVGIWILMITFGAQFGYTVMGRIALLVGRMQFLLRDWLGMIP